MQNTVSAHPPVVSREEWLAARIALLEKEKAFTRAYDALNAERRRLPMVKIAKDYRFEGPAGPVSMKDLFEGRSQLIVYHFMFEPGDAPEGKGGEPFDVGCSGCSHFADSVGHLEHLHARDTSLVMVSRAKLEKIKPFQARMGWHVPWLSSFGSDFNYDFHVTQDESVAPLYYNYMNKETLLQKRKTYHMQGEQHGLSVFLSVGDEIYHTYSTYGRGVEFLINTFQFLDLTPYGRQEKFEDSPEGWPQTPTMEWLRHHDSYDNKPSAAPCCRSSASTVMNDEV